LKVLIFKGAPTIRAYGQTDRFSRILQQKVDAHVQVIFSYPKYFYYCSIFFYKSFYLVSLS